MRLTTDIDALDTIDLGPESKYPIVGVFSTDDTFLDVVDLTADPNGGMLTVAYLELGCLVTYQLARQVLDFWVRANRIYADENIRQTENTLTESELVEV